MNCRVQKFDALGKHLQDFGSRGSKDGQFQNPCGILVDANGIIIVSDWDNHRVQLFDPEGKFIGKFGAKGRFDVITMMTTVMMTLFRSACFPFLRVAAEK